MDFFHVKHRIKALPENEMPNWRKLAAAAAVAIVTSFIGPGSSLASDVVTIPTDVDVLDIAEAITLRPNYGTSFKVSAAPDAENIIQRIEVVSENGINDDWVVFALANPTDEPLERLLVVPHYRLVNSGVLRPDLGSVRVVKINASQGQHPTKENYLDSDVFRIKIDPGEIVTYVAELTTPDLPQIYLWQPEVYVENTNSYVLYQGMLLGIASLLALFLSIIVVIKGTILFPVAALLAWSVLFYLCVDFWIWSKLFGLKSGGDPLIRAGTEILLCCFFLLFNLAYINFGKWRSRLKYVGLIVIVFSLSAFGVALADPSTGSGIARVFFAVSSILGMIAIGLLALKKHERAILLVPTWLLLLFWIAAAALAVTGQLDNEVIQPALNGGLVLIVLLVGFSVMQPAFAVGAIGQGVISDVDRRALAMIGSGDIIWEWDVGRDRVHTDSAMEEILQLRPGSLQCSTADWLQIIHAEERAKFRTMLDAVVAQKQGRIIQTFRFREDNGNYRTFLLKARSVLGPDAEVTHCIGSLHDVTDFKMTEERLLHDAIFDSLTGLPNQFLFTDRLRNALNRIQIEGLNRPAVVIFSLDEFDEFIQIHGVSAGDSILLSVSQKLNRLLKPQDGLSRLSGGKFAMLMESVNSMNQVKEFAAILQKSLHAPIAFGETTAKFTCSIGIAMAQERGITAEELLSNGEIAMENAKNIENDSVVVFQSKMRSTAKLPNLNGDDLRTALEKNELTIFYQPIVNIQKNLLAGFEATIRWRHPVHGQISPTEIFPLAEQSGLIGEIANFLLVRTTRQLANWQKKAQNGEELFICLSLNNRQFMSYDLINAVRNVLSKHSLSPRTLKLDLNESLVMQNPEFAVNLLERLKSTGVGLSLDGFGRGHSSLNYLENFPFDLLKFDRSSAHPSSRKGDRLLLFKNVVGLAKDLGMDVVAVGLNTDKEVSELVRIDCKFGQGNLYGLPMAEYEADGMVVGK